MFSRLLGVLLLASGLAFASAPRVFYTDLDSGPNTGGQNGNGAFVTVYGNNFGATRGASTVTFGGGLVAAYTSWSNTKVVVELGALAATGSVVVTVGGVGSNTDVSFTVRAGNIYFVSTTGSDTNPGSFASPFGSITKCKNTLAAGDICYIENGYTYTGGDTFNTNVYLGTSGTAGNPKALVAYPGATVTLGNNTHSHSIQYGANYWTVAGFHMSNQNAISAGGHDHRIVANVMTCPTGDGQNACLESSSAIGLKVFGNEVFGAGCGEDPATGALPCGWITPATTISTVGTALTISGFTSSFTAPDTILAAGQQHHVTACSSSTSCTLDSAFSPDLGAGTAWQFRDFAPNKQYHSFYFSSDSSNIEVGWNDIHDNLSCRGIQFYSTANVTGTVSTSSTTPVILTMSASVFLTTGQRAHLAGNSVVPDGDYFVSQNDSTHYALFTDKTLSTAVTAASSGTGGTLSNGLDQFDLSVHDNIIHDQTCDGINFATVDPSTGPVVAYNNLIYRVGKGVDLYGSNWAPVSGDADYAAIYSPAFTNNGAVGSGNIEIYNNSFYDDGLRGGGNTQVGFISCYAVPGNTLKCNFTNNIFLSTGAAQPYVTVDSYTVHPQNAISGTFNLWFGNGAPLSPFTSNLNVDPQFVSTATPDFHLQGTSPALSAGTVALASLTDFDGLIRPNPPSRGAYELSGAGTLGVSPGSLSFVCPGATPQSVLVTATGLTLDNWSATKGQSWLTLSPANGTAAGSFSASVNCAGLLGTSNDTISVSSTTVGITNSPQTVGVTVNAPAAAPSTLTLRGVSIRQ